MGEEGAMERPLNLRKLALVVFSLGLLMDPIFRVVRLPEPPSVGSVGEIATALMTEELSMAAKRARNHDWVVSTSLPRKYTMLEYTGDEVGEVRVTLPLWAGGLEGAEDGLVLDGADRLGLRGFFPLVVLLSSLAASQCNSK